jgi:hypothetical protein
MSVYPSNVPTTGDLPDAGANLSSNPHSSLHDDVRDEVIAIAGELGVEPSGTAATVRARLDDGLGLREVVTFTSNGTFTKATYPWLRAVRVRVHGGGGGGGGGGSTAAGTTRISGGGAGGGYAESFLLASAVGSSETVTVGAGGAGGAATGDSAGTSGGASSFGSLVTADGGGNGFTIARTTSGVNGNGVVGATSSGQIAIRGGNSTPGITYDPSSTAFTRHIGGAGGDSTLGRGARQVIGETAGRNGESGTGFGGGGGGGCGSSGGGAYSGGDGAAGVVIVELYA